MKKKQLKEMAQKTAVELDKSITELKNRLEKLKLEILSGKNKNKRAGRSLRKEIAQMKTFLSQKRNV